MDERDLATIHLSRQGDGIYCAFTGPRDDERCGTPATMHVLVLAGTDSVGNPDVIGMRTCTGHVLRAVEAAVSDHGDQWWVHRFHPACAVEASTAVTDSYCVTPDMTPDERCEDCGHWNSEHGASGCAADDEAAMGGCWCEVTA